MTEKVRSKTFNLMKLAICVGIGVALGISFRDFDLFGIPAMSIGPAVGVGVAYWWSKPERQAHAQSG